MILFLSFIALADETKYKHVANEFYKVKRKLLFADSFGK